MVSVYQVYQMIMNDMKPLITSSLGQKEDDHNKLALSLAMHEYN